MGKTPVPISVTLNAPAGDKDLRILLEIVRFLKGGFEARTGVRLGAFSLQHLEQSGFRLIFQMLFEECPKRCFSAFAGLTHEGVALPLENDQFVR